MLGRGGGDTQGGALPVPYGPLAYVFTGTVTVASLRLWLKP